MSFVLKQSCSSTNDAAGAVLTAVTTGGVSANNLLIAAVVWDFFDGGYKDSSGVTDSMGHVWSYATGASAADTTNHQASKVYYTVVTGSSTMTISANYSAANTTFKRLTISEFSGNATVSPFDSATAQFNSTGSTSPNGVNCPPITPGQGGSLIFSITEDSIGGAAYTQGTGYSKIQTATDLSTEWFEQAVAASISGLWTYDTSNANTTHVVAFKPLAGATVVPVPTYHWDFATMLMGSD